MEWKFWVENELYVIVSEGRYLAKHSSFTIIYKQLPQFEWLKFEYSTAILRLTISRSPSATALRSFSTYVWRKQFICFVNIHIKLYMENPVSFINPLSSSSKISAGPFHIC